MANIVTRRRDDQHDDVYLITKHIVGVPNGMADTSNQRPPSSDIIEHSRQRH